MKFGFTLLILQNFYSRKPLGLAGALQDLGIQFAGREHSGTINYTGNGLFRETK